MTTYSTTTTARLVLALLALSTTTHAFVPVSLTASQPLTETPLLDALVMPVNNKNNLWTLRMSSAGFLGMDDEDDDDDDEDDDEEDEDVSTRFAAAASTSPFGLKLDPDDPNPLIKPRPSRYFRNDDSTTSVPSLGSATGTADDVSLTQTMSAAERQENLTVLRRLRKSDLPDLKLRKDHAGWVEANHELQRRLASDPWFALNERLKDAIMLGQAAAKITALEQLVDQVDGPPPGIIVGPKGYVVHTELYDIPLSASRAASMLEREVRNERAARGRAMMQERRKNEQLAARQYEEDLRNPGLREDKEAKERRERTMRRLMAEIEDDNAKKRERAKEILGSLPDTPASRTESMDKALKAARDEFKKSRRAQLSGENVPSEGGLLGGDADTDEMDASASDRPKSGADKAREAAAAEAAGGRPRLPGDDDVTQGDIDGATLVEASSTTVTGPLQVEVTSSYNAEQSDPPMRKHCFQYTIRITNESPTDTIQLLGRRFEIQTVGSSMKDVVQGEGVTGRTPVLTPGEVFEYTSTAPLSVRPLGTTIIAARMRGDYRYTVLAPGQETASDNASEETAALGTFHFIFPDGQRVQPFRSAEDTTKEEEEDEEEEDDDDTVTAPTTPTSTTSPAPATASSTSTAATPASTLPGDKDMIKGEIAIPLNDSSEAITEDVRVQVTSSYRPERSDEALGKHCFAYNIRITNESNKPIQLVSRRFEIQTIASQFKDVVQGPGVTGRQPILQPGESFEYTSTAPLSVRPLTDQTPVVARMQGEYNFVKLTEDSSTPVSSTPLQAKLALFHFILPAVV
jgi:ApaG protein